MNKQLVLKQSVLAVALAVASTDVVLAQQSDTSSTPTVYITGSNLKRTAKEGTAPVQVISTKDIRDSGAATVTELMRLVPSMGSDQNLDTNDGGFSRGVSTASLRGLSSSATLILLNGRRMTPSAYADPNTGNSTLYDLNAIPLSALDRVEILKDGASAVYGSDAIGGVINFITRSNYKGLEVAARASGNDDGNFARKGANFFWGMGDIDDDGFNVFLTADVSQRDRVGRDEVRDIEYDTYKFLNNRYATPYGSTVSAFPALYRETAPGSGNFAVNRNNMGTRLVVNTNCDPARLLTGATNMGLAATSVFIGRQFCNFNTNQYLEGAGAGKDASLMSRGILKLGGGMKAFAELAYTRSARDYTTAPITLGQGVTTNFASDSVVPPYQTILEIGHPDNPFPAARASIGYRFENLAAGTRTVNHNTRLVTGVQGTVANWDWETALLYNGSQRDDLYFGRLYLPTLRRINAGASLATVAADPTVGHDVVNDNKASILHWDVKANTTFGQLAGGAMGLAMGAEIRREKLTLTPDPLLASGQIFGLANSSIDGQRDVKSAFIELRTPFLKNFEMDFAGRADKYPGIKTNFVPKVGAKWTITEAFAVRGTLARGFRAPALNQVTPGGSQFFESGIYDPRRCEIDESTPKPGATEVDCNKTAGGVGAANPDLVPEKSKSFSLGFLYSPTSSMDFGVDLYKIRKEGEVALGSAFEALRNEDTNPGVVQRDQNPDNLLRDTNGNAIPGTGPLLFVRLPWTNQGATEVQGVDFDAAYRRNLGEWGAFSAKLTSSYLYRYTLAQHPGDVEHNLAGYQAGLVDWNLSSGSALPRWKTNLSASLANGPHAFSASINFVGKVSLLRKFDGDTTYDKPFCHYGTRQSGEPNRAAGNPNYEAWFPKCEINSWTRLGVGYTYTGIKNLSLNLNIQNLLDTPAPYDPGFGTNTTTGAPLVGYNEGLHNPYGRYFSLVAKYTF
ncbi:MAG TPA: TonB-dependent receptor [Telluria sp.]|jgi:iron complex outermembrane receptor protein